MAIHVVFDLETFGTPPGCAIRPIGAVVFDLDKELNPERTLYANISARGCLWARLHIEEGTP